MDTDKKLKAEKVIRKKPVPGYTGVGTLINDPDGSQFAIVCASAEELTKKAHELLPGKTVAAEKFQNVTIIPAK